MVEECWQDGLGSLSDLVAYIWTPALTTLFRSWQASFDVDLGFIACKEGGKVPGEPFNIPGIHSQDASHEYSASNGVLVDFSLKGV